MDNRRYNIFFHLHTVSGITISLLLFIIFFCGAFALFRAELETWETFSRQQREWKGEGAVTPAAVYREVVRDLSHSYGRTISIRKNGDMLDVHISESLDTLAKAGAQHFRINPVNGSNRQLKENYGGGTLLYWLHFYWQFGVWGYYLAGLVSLFFFFAIVTGVLVHWKKIRSNFFVFRPWVKAKQKWTDLHTALGMIGLPFQFLYALTGSMFGLGVLIALVSSGMFYNGDTSRFYEDEYPFFRRANGRRSELLGDIAPLLRTASEKVPGFGLENVEVANLASDSSFVRISGHLPSSEKIAGKAELVFDGRGHLIRFIDPKNSNYLQAVPTWMFAWHYAEFDIPSLLHYVIRFCWFVMAMICCVVIISGILIWEKAREKQQLPPRRLNFNRVIIRLFLSVSYAFIPAAPAIVLISRVVPLPEGEWALNSLFTLEIAAISGVLWFRNNHAARFYAAIWLTLPVLLLLPVLTKLYSGQSLIGNYQSGELELFITDIFWLFLALCCTVLLWRRKREIVKKPVHQV